MNMNRREAMALMGGLAVSTTLEAQSGPQTVAPPFWKSRLSDVQAAVRGVKKGRARVLVQSAGKRDIHLVTYGEKQNLKGTANYNSACGGLDPASYTRKDGTQKPVVFLLGPMHGNEFDGTVGLMNLIRIAETRKDWREREWKELADNIACCRVLIVPCGNPDGRARCRHDSWVGVDRDTSQRAAMGVMADGTSLEWPIVKRIHPMRGAAVKTLGAYFNDSGVNLMHDEWFDPMAAETRAFLRLAREEAPDFIVSLHARTSDPAILSTAYVPRAVKEKVKELGDRVQRRYAAEGLPHEAGGPVPREDGVAFPPPPFNLTSALHHACGAVTFTHECCRYGSKSGAMTHEQMLDIQLLLYDELFKYAVERPVVWMK